MSGSRIRVVVERERERERERESVGLKKAELIKRKSLID